MSKLYILNKDFRYTQMPLLNFLYLSLQDQDNIYLFYGLIISFILLIILRVARRHHLRVAQETGRTKMKEMAEDMYRDKLGGVVISILYILYLCTFYTIATTVWLTPYTQVLLFINLSALVTQFATVYYERKLMKDVFIKPYWKKWVKRGKS